MQARHGFYQDGVRGARVLSVHQLLPESNASQTWPHSMRKFQDVSGSSLAWELPATAIIMAIIATLLLVVVIIIIIIITVVIIIIIIIIIIINIIIIVISVVIIIIITLPTTTTTPTKAAIPAVAESEYIVPTARPRCPSPLHCQFV